jgi:hypothetical protein
VALALSSGWVLPLVGILIVAFPQPLSDKDKKVPVNKQKAGGVCAARRSSGYSFSNPPFSLSGNILFSVLLLFQVFYIL